MKTSIPFLLACAVQLFGCGSTWTVTSQPTPVGYTEITSAPVQNIEIYPSTVYEGRTVYLYNERWYYREGNRWRFYRSEPPALAPQHQRFRAQPRHDNSNAQHRPQSHEVDQRR